MKTNIVKGMAAAMLLFNSAFAQNTAPKSKIAVLSIDYSTPNITPEVLGNYVRIELGKHSNFEVMDRYDQLHIIQKKNLNIDKCYGKICLVEVGRALEVDKMLTGMIDSYGETFMLTLNLIDVKNDKIEKTLVKKYLNLPHEFPNIIMLAINELNGKPNDPDLEKKLTRKFNIDNSHIHPDLPVLNLSGPRFGAALITGRNASIMKAPRHQGGFDAAPYLFQFGYQFEKQYLTQGRLQALFEFIPLISGLEQGLFIPSMTILHGLRNNKNGLEFAFGPTVRLSRVAKGFYDGEGAWHLADDWDVAWGPNPYPRETRTDSRGYTVLEGGFVFALGCTYKSGSLNIPINAYVVPNRHGLRVGASFGFNTKGVSSAKR
jgi:hypothetical protein